MNSTKSVSLPIALCLFTSIAGSAAQSTSQGMPSAYGPTNARRAEVQLRIDALMLSIAEHDVIAFSQVLSSEVLARTAERGIDLNTLLEKQGRAIARTFNLAEGERPEFEIGQILVEQNALRVTLRFRGKEVEKPFYFVNEDGVLKFNFGPAGFSKTPPQGALFGKSNYTVRNVNIPGNSTFAINCYQGKNLPDATVLVPASSTRKIQCQDACGWWAGSIFGARASDGTFKYKKCDWNWWGADVVINLLAPGGWFCNDNC